MQVLERKGADSIGLRGVLPERAESRLVELASEHAVCGAVVRSPLVHDSFQGNVLACHPATPNELERSPLRAPSRPPDNRTTLLVAGFRITSYFPHLPIPEIHKSPFGARLFVQSMCQVAPMVKTVLVANGRVDAICIVSTSIDSRPVACDSDHHNNVVFS